MQNVNPMKLLVSKEICAILDGDSAVGSYNSKEIKMPYLSGADICGVSQLFGFPVSYLRNGQSLSRWNYMTELMEYCTDNNKCSNLLAYLFTQDKFKKHLSELGCKDSDEETKVHNLIISSTIKCINDLLRFGGNELTEIGGTYYVLPVNSKVKVDAPKMKNINREYIKQMAKRANEDIERGDFDSALTKSRTLLEETFCYVIEQKQVVPSDKGDIGVLYKQVKDLYNMHTDPNMDKRFNKLLSGLETIIQSISELRNKDSDAHGVGARRVDIRDYHALLLVNSSITLAEFILSVSNFANNK